MSSRSFKIVSLAKQSTTEDETIRLLNLPAYETTKGTTPYHQQLAIENFKYFGKQVAYVTPTKKTLSPSRNNRPLLTNVVRRTIYEPIEEIENDDLYQVQNTVSSDASSLASNSESEYVPSTESPSSSDDVSDDKNIESDNDEFIKKFSTQYLEDRRVEISPADNLSNNLSSNHSENATDKSNKFTDQSRVSENNFASLGINTYNEESDSSITSDQDDIIVKPSKNKSDGKRIRDKRHICYFCSKPILHMARHFENTHGKEMDIARVLAMPKNSARRKEAFSTIIKAGDFYHNCEVLTIKQGELILVRRPSKGSEKLFSYSDYGPCPECLGFMLKKHLWNHLKYGCTKNRQHKENDCPLKEKRFPIAESNAIINEVLGVDFPAEFVSNIISKFKDDEIGQVCRNDTLILKFGALQYEKYSTSQCELIRQSMRQLARFTMEVKNMDNQIKSLSDCFNPQKFDTVIKAVKSLCVVHVEMSRRPEYQIPSLALKLGHAFRKCISIERGTAIKKGDLNRNETLLSFLTLLELEWNIKISSNALSTLHKRKLNCTQSLPLTSDLVKLTAYLDKNISKSMQDISSDKEINHSWSKLCALTLTRIILFNKRRSGEAARMTLYNYASRPNWSEQCTQELKSSLSPPEIELASKLTIVEIEGKRGRKVPVLLTAEMKESLDLLIKTRTIAGINEKNIFVFANSLLGYIRGHDCVRKFCNEAELESPNLITGTKLRKYVATVCQVFNLTENESDWLAKHLGHDVRVHREFYRLQENAVELTKISRLLLVVDKGEVNKYGGKQLKDINIKDLPPIDEESDVTDCDDNISAENKIKQTNSKENEIETNIAQDIKSTNSSRNKVSNVAHIDVSIKNQKGSRTDTRKQMRVCYKKTWTYEESSVVLHYFRTHIKLNNLPGKNDCEECMEKFEILKTRKWTDIKFYIKNHLSRINKKKN